MTRINSAWNARRTRGALLIMVGLVCVVSGLCLAVVTAHAGLDDVLNQDYAKGGDGSDEPGGMRDVLKSVLRTANMFFVVAIIIGFGVGAVMMGMKQGGGLMVVIWTLLGGILYFSTSGLITWMAGKGAGVGGTASSSGTVFGRR